MNVCVYVSFDFFAFILFELKCYTHQLINCTATTSLWSCEFMHHNFVKEKNIKSFRLFFFLSWSIFHHSTSPFNICSCSLCNFTFFKRQRGQKEKNKERNVQLKCCDNYDSEIFFVNHFYDEKKIPPVFSIEFSFCCFQFHIYLFVV